MMILKILTILSHFETKDIYMSNSSYCRFENTYSALRDCNDNIDNANLSEDEIKYRKRLISLCKYISDFYFDEDEFKDYQ